MSMFNRLMKAAGSALLRTLTKKAASPARRKPAPAPKARPSTPTPKPGGARPAPTRPATVDRGPGGEELSPGQAGPAATREINPASVGKVRTAYQPDRDGDADPGEIVWTWVPYEENDGRGKDRPVLVVARESAGTVLAVQLTSKDHDGDRDHVAIGTGSWDKEGRPSWVRIDRVFRVHQAGLRREASALAKGPFDRVIAQLSSRYGWN